MCVARPEPAWILVGVNRYLVRWTDDAGRRHDWDVVLDCFDGTGSRKRAQWHAVADVASPDREQWDRPVRLGRRIRDVRGEFLMQIVHGWETPYGFHENRRVYGKDGVRRERAHVLAELTGRVVCPVCHGPIQPTATGLVTRHGPHSQQCRGSGRHPAVEPELEAWRT